MITPAQARKRKKAAEAYAVKHHLPIPKGFAPNLPVIGPQARKLVREIEHQAWPNLPTTGEFNTKMLHLLFPPKPVNIGTQSLKTAKSQLGIKENPAGSNHGIPQPTGYQHLLGLDHQPWCACFVTWCLVQNGWKEKGWNQAYVPSWVSTAEAHQHGLLTISPSMVQPGDIVTFDWDNDGIADHIGFTDSTVDSHGNFKTIEGNTSAGSNSNGGAVQARERNVNDIRVFIRLVPSRV